MEFDIKLIAIISHPQIFAQVTFLHFNRSMTTCNKIIYSNIHIRQNGLINRLVKEEKKQHCTRMCTAIVIFHFTINNIIHLTQEKNNATFCNGHAVLSRIAFLLWHFHRQPKKKQNSNHFLPFYLYSNRTEPIQQSERKRGPVIPNATLIYCC